MTCQPNHRKSVRVREQSLSPTALRLDSLQYPTPFQSPRHRSHRRQAERNRRQSWPRCASGSECHPIRQGCRTCRRSHSRYARAMKAHRSASEGLGSSQPSGAGPRPRSAPGRRQGPPGRQMKDVASSPLLVPRMTPVCTRSSTRGAPAGVAALRPGRGAASRTAAKQGAKQAARLLARRLVRHH